MKPDPLFGPFRGHRSARAALGLALVAATVPLAGWPASAQEATPAAATPTAGVASVRVVHASPDAPAVDVYVDGAKAVEELPFGTATEYVALPAGPHDLAVVPTGGDLDDAVIEVEGAALDDGKAYEIAAVGLLDEIAAEVYEIDLAPVAPGQSRLRVVHASPDAPDVDVAVADGPVLVEEASFPDASPYTAVDAGVYDLEVRPTGEEEVALALPNTAIPAGAVVDVFAVGQVANGSLSVLILTAPATTGVPVGGGGGAPPLGLAPPTPPDPSADYTGQGFARRALATPAGRMVYYEAGEGQPLLFLHGIGGGASGWTLSKVAPAFTDRYRVIVPDFVGWGASEHPSRFLLFDDYAAQVDALLDALDEPAIVVAQSLTSGFVADVAETNPDRIAALIMLTPIGGKDFGEDAFDPFVRQTLVPVARSEVNTLVYPLVFPNREFLRAFFERDGFFDPQAVDDEIVDASLWSASQPGAAYSALPFLSGDLRYDFAPYLRDLEVPSALIYGADLNSMGRETRDRLVALRPDLPLVLVDQAKSTPELEHPAQVAAAIDRLVDELVPSDEV